MELFPGEWEEQYAWVVIHKQVMKQIKDTFRGRVGVERREVSLEERVQQLEANVHVMSLTLEVIITILKDVKKITKLFYQMKNEHT
jgi:hypothetical protein